MSIGLATFGDCDPCCGGDECLICSDDFDRADSSDVSTGSACGWTETAGNPTIESNALKFTGANSILLCNTPHPDGFSSTKISTNVKASATGNLARIIVGWADSSNYCFAEWKAGTSGYLRIYRKTAGADTQLATTTFTTPLDTYFTFSACVTNVSIKAELGGILIVAAASVPDEPEFGLGTGGTLSGSVHFDDFTAEKVSADCAQCDILPCTACSPQATTPLQWQIVISGVQDASCSVCESLDGTYILDQVSGCIWDCEIDPAICSYTRLRLTLNPSGSFLLYVLEFGPTSVSRFGNSVSYSRDCSVDGRTLVGTLDGNCHVAGVPPVATATLTPLA